MNHSGEQASQATLDETVSQWGFMHRLCWTSFPGFASFASQSLSIARTTWHNAEPISHKIAVLVPHDVVKTPVLFQRQAFSPPSRLGDSQSGLFANFCLEMGWFGKDAKPASHDQSDEWPVKGWFLPRLLWFRVRWLSWSGTSVLWFFHRQRRSACRSVSKAETWCLVDITCA